MKNIRIDNSEKFLFGRALKSANLQLLSKVLVAEKETSLHMHDIIDDPVIRFN